jgi:hypothetical protein
MNETTHTNEDKPAFSCSDKLVFDTRDEAASAAVAIEHQRGTKLKAYSCRDCQLWHLASE